LGGTVHDVILVLVTGALRRFLQRRHVHPDTVEFRVMAPVSVRTKEERGVTGNRLSVWLLDLPVDERNPLEQLKRIRRQTAELKESKQAMGAEILTQMAEWTSTTLLSLGARAATRLLPFNMVVTNVPGPQFPLYLLEARMLACIPHVPLFEKLGLGVALMSYDGKLFWGFNADYDLLPDLRAFAKGIEDAFDEVLKEVGQGSETFASRLAEA
jgi:WS/DGAT/MGAT family acyltransferase